MQHRWFRSRAEAAILEARGDTAGALEKLTEVEAAIRTLPESAQRETLLRLLARWKGELERFTKPCAVAGREGEAAAEPAWQSGSAAASPSTQIPLPTAS